jgi:hypothetical protein
MTKPPAPFEDLLDELSELVGAKNAAYSGHTPGDGLDPWSSLRGVGAEVGVTAEQYVLLRLNEKRNRILSLRKGEAGAHGESIRDSAMDSAAFWLIYVCLLDEDRPTPEWEWWSRRVAHPDNDELDAEGQQTVDDTLAPARRCVQCMEPSVLSMPITSCVPHYHRGDGSCFPHGHLTA